MSSAKILNFSIFCGFGLALLIHASTYYPFLSDDALISFRYAERFASGLGLTFTPGERVEGYTNFLWVLILAIGSFLNFDLEVWSRLIGFLSVWFSIPAFTLSVSKSEAKRDRLILAGTLISSCVPLAIWILGSLEFAFLFFCLSWGFYNCNQFLSNPPNGIKNLWFAGLWLGLALLTRADIFVMVGAVAIGLFISQRNQASLWFSLKFVCIPTGFFISQFLFRLFYYDSLVPNTAKAKVGFTVERLSHGFAYVKQGLLVNAFYLGLAFFCLHYAKNKNASQLFVFTFSSWLLYVTSVGGDFFPGWRLFIPALVPLFFLLLNGFEEFHTKSKTSKMVLVILIGFLFQHLDVTNIKAKTESWPHEGKVVGEILRKSFGNQAPLLAVDAAGSLPFFSKLPTLDMLGLTDRYLAENPPADFGRGVVGHELGDSSYTWERKPDILAFCNAVGAANPCFRGGHGLVKHPEFEKTYRLVKIFPPIEDIISHLYLRAENGKLSIMRTKAEIVVPHYFLGEIGDGKITTNSEMIVETVTTKRAGIKNLFLPKGNWKIIGLPSNAKIKITCDGSRFGNRQFTLANSTSLDLEIQVNSLTKLSNLKLAKQNQNFQEICRR